MDRREFLQQGITAGALAVSTALSMPGRGQEKSGSSAAAASRVPAESRKPDGYFDEIFLTILGGFLRNAAKTDPTYATCDFPGGTMLKGCSSPSGKTYVSVARMLPALASWVSGGRTSRLVFSDQGQTLKQVPTGSSEDVDLRKVLLSIYRNAFNPDHPHFWGWSNPRKADQRQVEASLVSHALWVLGDSFLEELGSKARSQVQAWLASCTVVPEHKHNHAWFSALNQAVRLALAPRWPEFSGDAEWMEADLQALDKMAVPGGEGWYNDYPGYEVYDWYNSWTYGSHFLLWNEVIGSQFPEWQSKFTARLADFLVEAPEFFGANGANVLLGRSLIYRWAAVTAPVLSYVQGQWPHSPGLLRSLLRRNIDFYWQAGAFDPERGCLRETFAPASARGIRERYIDNGHPYWAMQAFAIFRLPQSDPFWTASEEPLPVEKADFVSHYPALGMSVVGTKRSGQVRWLESRNLHRAPYRDKYIKFGYSSHFPFNVFEEKGFIPWDQTLVFRMPKAQTEGINKNTSAPAVADRPGTLSEGAPWEYAARSAILKGELLADGSLVTHWAAQLGPWSLQIVTRVRTWDELEERAHTVCLPAGAGSAGIEFLEGSYSMGLDDMQSLKVLRSEEGSGAVRWSACRNEKTGALVFALPLSGYESVEATVDFPYAGGRPTHILNPHVAVNTVRGRISTTMHTMTNIQYASPAPYSIPEILRVAGLAT